MGESRFLLVFGKGGWINGYEKGTYEAYSLLDGGTFAEYTVECDRVLGRLGVKVGTPAVAAKATIVFVGAREL